MRRIRRGDWVRSVLTILILGILSVLAVRFIDSWRVDMANKHIRAGVQSPSDGYMFRTCGGKRQYASKKEAKETAKSAYRCPFCLQWHATSGRRRGSRRIW